MIVHDIRSPLTTIMGLAQLLQLKNRDDEQAEFIAKMLFQANRLDSMLNDMLMMAKMESEKTLLNPTVVDVTEMAAEIGDDFRELFKVKNIRFISKLPDQPCLKTLDRNLFKRVLDNLMSNAYKFSPSRGTVSLKIECTETDSDPLLTIQVSDQGMGIPLADREKIFHKYEIVKLKQKGITQVGLGLKFCHMVVKAHGGKIYIRDNEPEGSIFTVEI
jgi:signal transduction histidine kinase